MNIRQVLRLPLAQKKALFKKARKAYYNDAQGRTLMSDDDFDRLEEAIRDEDPDWAELKKTGAPIQKKVKVKLEYKMPSLDKVKPETVQRFLDAHRKKIINTSLKLDGAAIQVHFDKQVPVAAFTRGNGDVGGDISFLLPHLKIPRKIPYSRKFVVRCEGAFTASVFKKYAHEFDAARNAASGLLNRSSNRIHTATRDLDVIVVRVLEPRIQHSKGLAYAKKYGFQVVPNISKPAESLRPDRLAALLDKKKAGSKYQLDGLVLTLDEVNPRDTNEKPSYAVAFKTNLEGDEAPTATVEDVVWQVSSFGTIVPKVILSPTQFEGAIVRRATVNNAKWMYDRKIGPGAVVRLVRSGEIIPKIIEVVKPGRRKLPPASVGKYQWDENGTHLVLLDKSISVEAKTRGLVRFFRGVSVDFIGPGEAAKMYEGGFTTVLSILRATKEDFLKLPGIQDRKATKLYNAVQVLYTRGVELPKLMEASGAFPKGMGEKRIKQIAKIEPDLLGLAELSPKMLTSILLKIPMFSDTMAAVFVEGIYPFVKWFKKTKIKIVQPTKVKLESNKLNGLRVSWTGYRSPEQENAVKVSGGEVVSFGSSTQVLLYSPTGKSSTKVDKAQAKGIATLTWDQFSKKHKL